MNIILFRQAAISYNQVELAKFLLDNGAEVEKKDKDGNLAIHYCEEIESLDLLLSKGANIMALNNENKTVSLIFIYIC